MQFGSMAARAPADEAATNPYIQKQIAHQCELQRLVLEQCVYYDKAAHEARMEERLERKLALTQRALRAHPEVFYEDHPDNLAMTFPSTYYDARWDHMDEIDRLRWATRR